MRVRSCFKHRRPEASRRLFLFTKRLLQQLFASTIVLMATPFLGPCLAEAPDHLLILVFDQMRPDYVERFDLPNFKSLRARSTEYPNAYVGHLASVTVVSHAVLARGLLPKELPWRDNLFWDIAGELGKANKFYDTHALTSEQFLTLTSKHPTPGDLAIRLKNKLGGRVVVVGEKHYAAMSFGLPSADSIITLKKESGRCFPSGVKLPTYISDDPRFSLDCSSTYGTEESFYPYDGAKLTPGLDAEHLGGDVWTADAALKVMEREEWTGMFVTFGGIDKAGHVFGTMDFDRPHPFESAISLESMVRLADVQLGRLLDQLRKQHLDGRTLIVATADHGSQSNRYYLGNARGDQYGEIENGRQRHAAPFWIERLAKFGAIRAAQFDSAIRVWLEPEAPVSEKFLRAFAEISGVTKIFRLESQAGRWTYRLAYRSNAASDAWHEQHDEELVNTMASRGSPDFVALLEDGVGFDLLGEHGGAQEKVQRIPMFVSVPGRSAQKSERELRLVDVAPLVSETMQLP